VPLAVPGPVHGSASAPPYGPGRCVGPGRRRLVGQVGRTCRFGEEWTSHCQLPVPKAASSSQAQAATGSADAPDENLNSSTRNHWRRRSIITGMSTGTSTRSAGAAQAATGTGSVIMFKCASAVFSFRVY
jgi:hypothetical protein